MHISLNGLDTEKLGLENRESDQVNCFSCRASISLRHEHMSKTVRTAFSSLERGISWTDVLMFQ